MVYYIIFQFNQSIFHFDFQDSSSDDDINTPPKKKSGENKPDHVRENAEGRLPRPIPNQTGPKQVDKIRKEWYACLILF